jgi:hypothetical protein
MENINTHHLVVNFGKHKGELWTRVPADYLQWLVNQPVEKGDKNKKDFEQHKKIAKAELERRGTDLKHDVEITPHSVDKASLRCRKIWHETCKENEGIYSWLCRIASLAITEKGQNSVIKYSGIKFVFKLGNNYPILKTVMPLEDN